MSTDDLRQRGAEIQRAMLRSQHRSINALAKATGVDRKALTKAIDGTASERTYLRLESFLGLLEDSATSRRRELAQAGVTGTLVSQPPAPSGTSTEEGTEEPLGPGRVEIIVTGPKAQVRLRGPVSELAALETATHRIIDQVR